MNRNDTIGVIVKIRTRQVISIQKRKDRCYKAAAFFRIGLFLLLTLALNELRKIKQDNLISEEDNIFDITSEFANSGFMIIQDMVDFDDYDEDEDDFVQQLIAIMDEKYEAITSGD